MFSVVVQESCLLLFFADDEPISESGLKMPTVIDLAKENLQSKLQNLTKVLQPSDNGKNLRCVAFHPAYPGGYAETKRQLDVKCKWFLSCIKMHNLLWTILYTLY